MTCPVCGESNSTSKHVQTITYDGNWVVGGSTTGKNTCFSCGIRSGECGTSF